MSNAEFIIPLHKFCKENSFSFSIQYLESDDMFYDLEISSHPIGKFFYYKRPNFFNDELKKCILEALKDSSSDYAVRYDSKGKLI